ncbi:MAG TPA: hypothetical protein VFS31_14495 [Chitinophagaceae bacterium]|nr:hypothetical protein [Chitinophagaceae bacterium]
MRLRTFILATAVSGLVSCSQMNEQKYNDTVVNMYTDYSNNMTSKANMLSGGSTDKVKATELVNAMQKTTDSCITVMDGLKPSDAARDFHEKVLTVFRTVKNDFLPSARKLAGMQGSGDVDAYNKLVEEFNNTTSKLDKVETEAQAAQQVYVNKIGMKLR